jgi:isocitrate dehydrogenase kinase/phosphatase
MAEGQLGRAAAVLVAAFDGWRHAFARTTARGRERFAARDWAGIRADTVGRLELHNRAVEAARRELVELLADAGRERSTWIALKQRWAAATAERDDRELAQTFFNSVSRRVLPRRGVDAELDFLPVDFVARAAEREADLVRSYPGPPTAELVARLLAERPLGAPFADLQRDAAAAAERLAAGIVAAFGATGAEALEVLHEPFFRNKAAYVIGRARRGDDLLPVAFALLHGQDGVTVDAVLLSEDEVSIVFSFARWYFLVAAEPPRAVIAFLRTLLPKKRLAELYISLGHHKHGKTELYGDLIRTIHGTDDRFVRAPGKEGLVMEVFHLPTWEYVFKVIKDGFPPAKRVTRREIRDRYRLVLAHDRVGRLVDFQEFEGLTFPHSRFSAATLAELQEEAAGQLRFAGDEVEIRHLYIGRRVTPLDLFLAGGASDEEKSAAVSDWGWCLRDLAAGNVFAGDLLLKNFGVTRHGRVVFYDYDELQPLVELRFRRLPPSRDDDAEMASEPWFRVSEGDVFPEEFPRFLELTGELRRQFLAEHGCLFDPQWWQEMRRCNEAGELVDVFPYPEARRLRRA